MNDAIFDLFLSNFICRERGEVSVTAEDHRECLPTVAPALFCDEMITKPKLWLSFIFCKVTYRTPLSCRGPGRNSLDGYESTSV